MPVRRLASLTVLAVCLVPAALGLATPNGISTKRKFVNAGQRGSVVLIDGERSYFNDMKYTPLSLSH